MKKYFLDCGCNVGQATKYFINENIITKDMIVHLFEPNEIALKLAKENLQKYDGYNLNFHHVAIWKENCIRKLTLEYTPANYKCQLSNEIVKGDSNSGGATNIMENMWKKPNYIPDHYISEGNMVECIDFCEFLENNIEENYEIICKMDIEGAEFCVLDKLISNKNSKLIKKLYIEWHNHLLHENYDINMITKQLQAKGTIVEAWV
jgi:FkbM family methyltransferase